tara:strand:- start:2624 stop:3358 length:735 start_codon:yes stop_codon:yes gene_type:complete
MKNTNIIAMAGMGKRFLKFNASTPKPLLLIKKKPMFHYALKSLPKSDENIFICSKSLKGNPILTSYFKKNLKKKKIIYLKKKTSGQASTCKIASNFLKNKNNVIFSSCDYYYKFGKKKYKRLIHQSDVVVFAHRPTKNNILNFNQFGWIQKDKKNLVKKIECKKKVSKNPKKDLVIVGSFAFKNIDIFNISYREMIRKKEKIRNEYYMDTVVKNAKKLNFKITYLLVKDFKSFGTPKEFKRFSK